MRRAKRGSIGGRGGGGAPRPSADGSTFHGKWCGFLPSPSLRRSGGPAGRSGDLGGGVGVDGIARSLPARCYFSMSPLGEKRAESAPKSSCERRATRRTL